MATKKRDWMQKAVKRPGAFKEKAKRAHMTTQAFARKERNAPGTLGKEARLAITFQKERGKKKARKSTSKHSPRPHHKR